MYRNAMDEVARRLKSPVNHFLICGEEQHVRQKFAPRIGGSHRVNAILRTLS